MNTLETVHDNHRERVRQKFAAQGFTGWHDHEILELFLFYVMPRVDTNPTAHALIDEFGTLAQVLDADVDALKRVRGVGETTALYLHALGRLPSVYAQSKWDGKKTVLSNATATSLFCIDFIGHASDEVMGLICLDTQRQVKKKLLLSQGLVDIVEVSIRRIAEAAMGVNARYVVLCHNHPSGMAAPSYTDIETTKSIAKALSPLNIEVLDHIVVGGKTAYSMAEAGKL